MHHERMPVVAGDAKTVSQGQWTLGFQPAQPSPATGARSIPMGMKVAVLVSGRVLSGRPCLNTEPAGFQPPSLITQGCAPYGVL